MSFGDDIGKEYAKIEKKRNHTIKSAVTNLYSDLVEATPVDTGELEAGWQLPKKLAPAKWVVTNIAPHALVIDGGLRNITTKSGTSRSVGSEILPKGFGPIVRVTEKALEKALNK